MSDLKKFWDFWFEEGFVMEVRLKSFILAQEIAKLFRLNYSKTYVYVSSFDELEKVVRFIDKKSEVWMGINPRRKVRSQNASFPIFVDTNEGVDAINFFVIDIDRIKSNKEGSASKHEIQKMILYSNMIIDLLKNKGFTNFCKLFSGHGIHLIYKLDTPIILPIVDFDTQNNKYIYAEDITPYKDLLMATIGQNIIREFNTKKFREEFGCEIDKQGFFLSASAGMPLTWNKKHSPWRQRLLLNIDNNKSFGVSKKLEYALKNLDLPVYTQKKKGKLLYQEFRGTEKSVMQSKLAQFLTSQKLPQGGRHNKLLLSLKCLIRDNELDPNSEKIVKLFDDISRVQEKKYPSNLPREEYNFNPIVVNNYCIEHSLPLLYPPIYDKLTTREFPEFMFDWDNFQAYIKRYKPKPLPLDSEDSVGKDFYTFYRKLLDVDEPKHIDILYCFTLGLIQKYGNNKAKFYFQEYLPKYAEKI